MTQEIRDWRELCEAVVNERDPERLSELAEQLIATLDEREPDRAHRITFADRATASPNQMAALRSHFHLAERAFCTARMWASAVADSLRFLRAMIRDDLSLELCPASALDSGDS